MIEGLVARVLARPRVTVLVWIALLAVALAGAAQLRVDFSSASFYGDDATELETLQRFSERWGPDDRTLIVVARAEAEHGLLNLDALADLHRIATALAEDPAVARTTSFPQLRATASGPTVLAAIEALPGDQHRDAVRAAARARGVAPVLVSADGRSAAILVELAHSTDDLAQAVQDAGTVRDQLARYDGPLALEMAGIPAVRAAFFELTVRDQLVLGPIAFLVAAAGLWLVFRRPIALVAAAVGAGVPLLLLLGAMGWANEPIGLLNQAYFTLLPVIAVADTIHLVVRTDEIRRQRPDAAQRDIVREAAGKVGWACLLTSLTTALGFGSLALTSIPILRSFGLFAALGIAFAFATVVLLVPLLLRHAGAGPEPGPVLRWAGRVSVARGPAVLAIAAAAAVLAAWPAKDVVVDNHLSHLLQPDHPVRAAGVDVDTNLGGTLSLEFEVDRVRAASVRTWAEAQPEVRAVLGPFGSDPQSQAFIDGDRARVSVRVPDIGGRAFGAFERRARVALEDPKTTITGTTALAYAGVNRITAELRTSLLIVLAVVTIAIAVLLRDIKLALVSIAPNLLPLWLGYAAFGLTGIELDPIGVVILAVALGIAVDDTIHVLVRYVEFREQQSPRDAAAATIAHTGRAVAITSLVLAAGLGVNTLSSFPPLAVLGTLGAGVLVLAFVADVTVLPALLACTQRTQARQASDATRH